MEGRENDVSATKRAMQTNGGGGPEKEFKLVRFSPWPLRSRSYPSERARARESSR